MGRSWADHGQIMGRPWAIDSCRKILKISAFSDPVFLRKIFENLRFSYSVWTKRLVILADPAHVFFGKIAFIFDRISILHIGIVCFHNNDSFYTLKPVCFAKTCLIPRGRSCLAVRQWLLSSRDGGSGTWDSEEFDEEKPPGLHASAMRGRHGRRLRSFVFVLERSQENWRGRGTPRCCAIHGLITCAMSTMQKWWIRSVPCWRTPRTTP